MTVPRGTVILGVDPGLAGTGWGVITVGERGILRLERYGCIETKAATPLVDRLKQIFVALSAVIDEFSPSVMAVEELFFMKRATAVAAVGQARGAILLAAALKNISVSEYNPRTVKIALTGFGSADKQQIQHMVKAVLKLSVIPCPDHAADALAMAICHLHTAKY
ncbi:MAG: crossover junction endodeoxyribonuclease RuvC [Elusimicrobia bacterium]|nr:crossover junction endodeoxyribonuclease RuvC [Elusimicrobiota bacterium]